MRRRAAPRASGRATHGPSPAAASAGGAPNGPADGQRSKRHRPRRIAGACQGECRPLAGLQDGQRMAQLLQQEGRERHGHGARHHDKGSQHPRSGAAAEDRRPARRARCSADRRSSRSRCNAARSLDCMVSYNIAASPSVGVRPKAGQPPQYDPGSQPRHRSDVPTCLRPMPQTREALLRQMMDREPRAVWANLQPGRIVVTIDGGAHPGVGRGVRFRVRMVAGPEGTACQWRTSGGPHD